MEELRDIKEIVEVSDSSLLILILTLIAAALLIAAAVYFLSTKRRRRRVRPTPEALAKTALKSIDYKNAKDTAYCFSENAYRFVTEENRTLYDKIDEALISYKYKKEIPSFQSQTVTDMRQFIKGVR